MSSGLTPVFHQEMLNYKLKPSYEYQESMWKKYKSDKDKKLMSVKSFARAVWFASILYTKRYRHSIYIRTVSSKLLFCSSVRPKSGFDIGNQNPGSISVLVLEPKLFLSEIETIFFSFFQMLLCFSATLEDMNF